MQVVMARAIRHWQAEWVHNFEQPRLFFCFISYQANSVAMAMQGIVPGGHPW
jgi:hypothetical protein